MRAESIVYQTLEDRDNADYVEQDGPFISEIESAWLGTGYYFWDYHIQLGHWWGKTRYKGNNYMICKGFCDISPERCWDLHNEGSHREEFIKALDLLIEYNVADKKNITVAQVIEYAKENGFFNHEAIRALGINSATEELKSINVGARLYFTNINKKPYFDLYPAIQLCLIRRTSLSLRNYHVVWPEYYLVEDSVF